MFLTLLAPQTTGGITGDLSQSLGAVSLTGSGTVVNGPSGSLSSSLGSLTYASLRQGLVGAWCPSLGASGFRLIDRSGYGNHGTLTNMDPGTDWVPSGGKLALDFDGNNDYVLAISPQIGQITKNVSISIWENVSAINISSVLFGINIIAGNDTQRMSAHCPWSDGVIYWDFGGSSSPNRLSVSGQTFTLGKWDHFVFVAGDIGSQIWRNGNLIGSSTTAITRVANSNEFWIGGGYLASPYYHLGQIDDIRLYNRALTPQEIRLLYTGGSGVGLMPERIKHRRKATAGITGDLSKTLAALSASSSGSVTAGNSGSVSSVLAALTASASGSVANGPSGSVSASLGSLTCASQGTLADGASGNLSKTLDAATLSSSGTVSSGVTGDLSSTLAAATLSSDGTVANGPSGSLSSTLDAATLSASGNVAAGASGSLSVTLNDATLSSTGNVGSGTFGSVSQTLASATLSSDVSVAAGVSGSVSQTLAAATLSSSGTVAAGVSGSVSAQLGSLTSTSTGFVTAGLNGAVDAALGSLSLASSGSVAAGNTGSATVQLASAVLSASGTVVTPSVGATLHVRINGVWKATTPFVKVNGVWKQATAYTKVNGVWK